MKEIVKKLFSPKKTKLFWLYFVFGILLIVLGVVLMPVWSNAGDWCFFKSWGMEVVNIAIAAAIICYIALFQFRKLMAKSNQVVKILTIIEFIIFVLIALGYILNQFKVFNFGDTGACKILGLGLWCRGVIELFRAYYYRGSEHNKYPLYWLIVAILFVSVGVWLFVKPMLRDVHVLWVLVSVIYLVAITCIIDGFLAKPASKKTKKVKTSKK